MTAASPAQTAGSFSGRGEMLFKLFELLRFATVLAAGLVIDLFTGWSLNHFASVPLWQAAIVGFSFGAAFNYVAHEFWTFRNSPSGVSAVRGGLYLLANVVTLGVRVAVVKLLSMFDMFNDKPLAVLLVAVAASFVVNYQLSAALIFRARSVSGDADR